MNPCDIKIGDYVYATECHDGGEPWMIGYVTDKEYGMFEVACGDNETTFHKDWFYNVAKISKEEGVTIIKGKPENLTVESLARGEWNEKG